MIPSADGSTNITATEQRGGRKNDEQAMDTSIFAGIEKAVAAEVGVVEILEEASEERVAVYVSVLCRRCID